MHLGHLGLYPWIIYDTIIFIIEIFIFTIFILKLKIPLYLKISFFLFSFLFLSSYNILVIPIHYYNIIIPRTIVYNIKWITLCIISFIFLILFNKRTFWLFFRKKIFFPFYLILLDGTIAYILAIHNDKATIDNFMGIIRNYCNVFLLIFSSYLFYIIAVWDRLFQKKFIIIMSIIFLLNCISISLLDKKFIWIKWGLPVKVFDQSDPILILSFVLLIIFNYQDLRKKFLFISFGLGYTIYWSAFKNIYEETVSIIFLFFISKIKQFNKNLLFVLLCFYPIMLIIAILIIGLYLGEHSIKTRIFQMDNFYHYLINNIYFLLIGFGFNKAYYTYVTYPYDPGAWSIIEKNSIYKLSLQVPFISDFRDAGVVAIFLKFFIIYQILKKFLKLTIPNTWALFILFLIVISFIQNIIPWSPKIAIYLGFLLSLLFRLEDINYSTTIKEYE